MVDALIKSRQMIISLIHTDAVFNFIYTKLERIERVVRDMDHTGGYKTGMAIKIITDNWQKSGIDYCSTNSTFVIKYSVSPCQGMDLLICL